MAARKTHHRKTTARKPRRATQTHRRSTRSAAAPKTHRRRSYARRKKGFLSEMINPATAQSSANALIMGVAGGIAADLIVKNLFPTMKKAGRVGILAGLSFLSGSVLKAPNFAAGIGAIAGVQLMTPEAAASGISEQAYLQEQYLSQLPETLSDGYLSDGFLNEGFLTEQEVEDAEFYVM